MTGPLRIFIGYDPRQPLAYSVLQHSIARHSSVPVAITPLILSQLPITRRGLTEFTFSRFLVPWLCQFKGRALFLDADMVVTGDIAELFDMAGLNAVSVMQEQQRFEWASAMLFNCGACLRLTPDFIDDEKNPLLDLAWAPSIGQLPAEWNHCVGYTQPRDDAKLLHFTQGIPHWQETAGLPEDEAWHAERAAATHSVSWQELMGTSVHKAPTMKRFLSRYGIKLA
jgi:hypothetical protein